MTFQVGDIVRRTGSKDNSVTFVVLEVGNEYGIELLKVDDPRAEGWWEHHFWELAPDVRNDPRSAKALEPRQDPSPEPKVIDPFLLTLNEKLTLAAAAVIQDDKAAVELITQALTDVRTKIEE